MHRKGSKSPNRGANGSGMSGSKHIRHKSANPAAMRSSSQNERIQQIDDLCNMDLENMVINGAAIGQNKKSRYQAKEQAATAEVDGSMMKFKKPERASNFRVSHSQRRNLKKLIKDLKDQKIAEKLALVNTNNLRTSLSSISKSIPQMTGNRNGYNNNNNISQQNHAERTRNSAIAIGAFRTEEARNMVGDESAINNSVSNN